MTDARFPERWLNDRRVLRLPDDVFRLFVVGLAWSVANKTDGVLDDDDLPLVPGANPIRAGKLVMAGLWQRDGRAWLIGDFEETQTTSTDLAHLADARRKQRDKKRRQRAAAARREAGDVPGDVPGDTTRTGQARPGSPNTEGEGLAEPVASLLPTKSADEVGTNPAAELVEREHEVRAERSPKTPLPSKSDGSGSTTAVHRDQHFPGDSSAGANLQTVTRTRAGRPPIPEPKRQTILSLHAQGGLTLAQIAQQAGVATSTAHKVIHMQAAS